MCCEESHHLHPRRRSTDSPYPQISCQLYKNGRIVDTTEYSAKLMGFKSRQDALGASHTKAICARQKQHHRRFELLNELAQNGPVAIQRWLFTAEGWHFIDGLYTQVDAHKSVFQCAIITDALPYARWLKLIDFKKGKLHLESLIPGLVWDKTDLAIWRMALSGLTQTETADQLQVTTTTIERRMKDTRDKLCDALCESPECTITAQRLLNILELDGLLLANPYWLDYKL